MSSVKNIQTSNDNMHTKSEKSDHTSNHHYYQSTKGESSSREHIIIK